MKTYISGRITGIEKYAEHLFQQAEDLLLCMGREVINPMKLSHDHDKTWESYMKEDIKAMIDCDSIYMLNNWMESRGAEIEHDLAKLLGLKIEYEKS